jgi:predicted short-subunit dehydrogenase-like oxidoreductase (DUF2520 family)
MRSVRIIGPGRAGQALAGALAARGLEVDGPLGKGQWDAAAASGVDAVVLAVPDRVVAEVARALTPVPGTLVVHLAGALGLEVLAPHPRRASLHPLAALPDAPTGIRRLLAGPVCVWDGDPEVLELAEQLGWRPRTLAADRARYHACCSVAANHLVGLLGEVERLAASCGLALGDFLGLAAGALEDAGRLGPAAALTGPVARGDWTTLERHRAALPPEERAGYEAGVALCQRLVQAGSPPAAGRAGTGTGELAPTALAQAG